MNSLTHHSLHSQLTIEFHKDLLWCDKFLQVLNRKCDFLESRPVTGLSTDVSQDSIGACFEGEWLYYYLVVDYPWLSYFHVKYKEAIYIILAAYRWDPAWQNRTVVARCDITAAVVILNKGSNQNPHMMIFLREIFWLSSLFNFRLKAYRVPESVYVGSGHLSHLHESDHFLAYCCILKKRSIDIFSLPVCNHMPVRASQFLLGKYSQPPMFCFKMLDHLLIVFKEMSSIIASRHMLLIPRKVTTLNILSIVHFVH